MGVEKLTPAELKDLKPYGFDKSTPLWYYVLREAELRANGLTLGKVGGRIVAEVLIGLIQSDPSSYLVQKPDVDTDPHPGGIVVPDEGLPHLRRRRPGDQARREPRPRLTRPQFPRLSSGAAKQERGRRGLEPAVYPRNLRTAASCHGADTCLVASRSLRA